jgi:beta-lactamase superfamily II metal-dependent hydrolase
VPLHLDILDVGQGDGMLLWLPNGKLMMIDLGSTKNKGIITESVFKYFRDHTPFKNAGTELEWLVLTHGDRDHYNLVWQFITTFKPTLRNVLHGGLKAQYGDLITKLENRENEDGTKANILTGQNAYFTPVGSVGELGAEVVALACGVVSSQTDGGYAKNTLSVVLKVAYKGRSLMLTGDATRDTEFGIINYINKVKKDIPRLLLRSNVLKVGHHGSHRTSNHARWIYNVDTNYAFISSDRSGSLDEDEKATGHRLPQLLTLDLLHIYSERLADDCQPHPYVASYQKTDYTAFNSAPDEPNQPVPIPTIYRSEAEWVQLVRINGIFSTLEEMGTSTDPFDPGANDIGVQYRVTIEDNGDLEIFSTSEFDTFDEVASEK